MGSWLDRGVITAEKAEGDIARQPVQVCLSQAAVPLTLVAANFPQAIDVTLQLTQLGRLPWALQLGMWVPSEGAEEDCHNAFGGRCGL